MKCFYHSADLDGHCSGELVRRVHPECEMIGINYGEPFPWHNLYCAEETVFMVDFCLQPFSDMIRLNSICNLIWIDHHISAISEWEKAGCPQIKGIRNTPLAGCELTWKYFNQQGSDIPFKDVPYPVKLLGRYDVWDHSNPDVLPFQYGFRNNHDTKPGAKAWEILSPPHEDLWMSYISTGREILRYVNVENAKYLSSFGFATELDGIKAIAVNKGMTSSQIFDSDPSRAPIQITFVWSPKAEKWTVSLYSKTVDVSKIAIRYGGGGHKGASGFQCNFLPFTTIKQQQTECKAMENPKEMGK